MNSSNQACLFNADDFKHNQEYANSKDQINRWSPLNDWLNSRFDRPSLNDACQIDWSHLVVNFLAIQDLTLKLKLSITFAHYCR